jgi:hypothetical protein
MFKITDTRTLVGLALSAGLLAAGVASAAPSSQHAESDLRTAGTFVGNPD